MNLVDLGWTSSRDDDFAPHAAAGLVPARVAAVHGSLNTVWAPSGEHLASVSGRLRHEGTPAGLPATGDWVALALAPGDDRGTIHAVLPRRTCLSRRGAGTRTAEQVVAANVDAVFVLTGLDHDFNPRRVERLLVLARESGARPVVVLTKSDLAPTVEEAISTMAASAPGIPVLAVSARTGDGLIQLEGHLHAGETVVLVGSSGVGKSTLVNRLLGYDRQRTHEVRPGDSRGRHTTTHRELIPLRAGALLIDTPGLREVQLWAEEEAVAGAFTDIEGLASGCRFRDCTHHGEPACAVTAAVAGGALDPDRLASYRKLGRELRHLAGREDLGARLAEKARWKAIHKAARRRQDD